MRCFKSVITFITGIVVGIVLLVGSVAGVGYYFINKDNMMGTLETKFNLNWLKLSDEIKALSLYDYGTKSYQALANLSTATLGEIEAAIGADAITKKISDILGIDQEILKASTLSTLQTNITDNLTVETLQTKFKIEFPDFPAFKDADFLKSSIITAFKGLSDLKLDAFIVVVYDSDVVEDPSLIASSTLLQKLGPLAVKSISQDMQAVINDLKLSEVIKITDESNAVLRELKDTKIGDMGSSGTNDLIMGMKITDLLGASENPSKIFQYFEENGTKLNGIDAALQTMTIADMMDVGEAHIWKYLGDKTITTLGEAVDNMSMGDVIKIDKDSNAILRKMIAPPEGTPEEDKELFGTENLKIDDIGTKLPTIVQDIELGEMIDISDDSEPILLALKGTKVNQLNDAIAGLTISDIFKDADQGILSLVDPNTKLSALPNAVTDALLKTKMSELFKMGLITDPFENVGDTVSGDKKFFLYNQTLISMVANFGASLVGSKEIGFAKQTMDIELLATFLENDDVTAVFLDNLLLTITDFGIIPNISEYSPLTEITINVPAGKIAHFDFTSLGDNVTININYNVSEETSVYIKHKSNQQVKVTGDNVTVTYDY